MGKCVRTSLDVAVDGELTSSESANHEETSANTSIATTEAKLLSNLEQTACCAFAGEALSLVDLREHSIRGLGDDGGGETSDETGAEVDSRVHSWGSGLLVNLAVDCLGDLLVDDELGHGVRDLLEEDGAKARVEGQDTLIPQDLAKAAD